MINWHIYQYLVSELLIFENARLVNRLKSAEPVNSVNRYETDFPLAKYVNNRMYFFNLISILIPGRLIDHFQ